MLAATLATSAHAQGTTQRGVTPEQQDTATAVENGKYYALVIGINTYPAPLPSLKTAENDAQAVAKTLHDDYGFVVTPLLGANATRQHILEAINRYEDSLRPNDNLLIYYAGHGYENKTTGKAYWLPVDANSTASSNRIIADDITTEMATIPARHILVISDSCYSGGLTRDASIGPRAGMQNDAFLKRMLSSRSRTLMASGGDEPVSDSGRDNHSIFAYALLQALSNEEQPIFSASDLFYSGVRHRVAGNSAQLPQYAVIRNSTHDDGDFIFTHRAKAIVAPTTIQPKPEETVNSPVASNTALPKAPLPRQLTPDEETAQGHLLYEKQDYNAALPLLKAACDAGKGEGCLYLGAMYEFGYGVAPDSSKAASVLRMSCDLGEGAACTDLGAMYLNGTGVTKDALRAVALFQKGCNNKNALGCANLGTLYGNGDDVPRDLQKALIFFKKGCEGNNAQACSDAGISYATGQGVTVDMVQANSFFRVGCTAGSAIACVNLGNSYITGVGVARDFSQAFILFHKSCDDGEPLGCNDLGMMYENGDGVSKDATRAASLFHGSCEANRPEACANLGWLYVNGVGVQKDVPKGKDLLQRGCSGGYQWSCDRLKQLRH